MTATYLDMVNRIIDELQLPAGSTTLTSQIKLEIQTAIQFYERDRFWFNESQQTIPTVAATASVVPPTDLVEIDSIDLTYSGHPYPLVRKDWSWYVAVGARDTTVGKAPPGNYVYYDQLLWLYPVPDNVYSLLISYKKQLATLSNDADTNAWMTEGETLIRSRARQAVLINYRRDQIAREEAALMASMSKKYLSWQEENAYKSLLRTNAGRLSTGRIVPTRF